MTSAATVSDFWSAHLINLERRDISVAEYARENDLSAQSLYGWRGRQRQSVAASPRRRFAEFVSVPPVRAVGVRVLLGGAALEFDELPDAAWLATLLVNVSTAR